MNIPAFRPLHELFQIIYPSLCCHCEEPLMGNESNLCTHCLSQISWCDDNASPNNITEQRFYGRIPFEAATSLMFFHKGNVTQDIIHQIKYHGNIPMAKQYGQLLTNKLQSSGRFDNIDVIIPVPLHRRRKRQRGYNQSEIICKAISSTLQKPLMTNILYRKQYTNTQTNKSRLDRLDNMNGVFAIRHSEQLENKHILLIDDVITTGATIIGCYDALRQITNSKLSIASLALTMG